MVAAKKPAPGMPKPRKKASAPKVRPHKRFSGDMQAYRTGERPSIEDLRAQRRMNTDTWNTKTAPDVAAGTDIYNDVQLTGKTAIRKRRLGTGGYLTDTEF